MGLPVFALLFVAGYASIPAPRGPVPNIYWPPGFFGKGADEEVIRSRFIENWGIAFENRAILESLLVRVRVNPGEWVVVTAGELRSYRGVTLLRHTEEGCLGQWFQDRIAVMDAIAELRPDLRVGEIYVNDQGRRGGKSSAAVEMAGWWQVACNRLPAGKRLGVGRLACTNRLRRFTFILAPLIPYFFVVHDGKIVDGFGDYASMSPEVREHLDLQVRAFRAARAVGGTIKPRPPTEEEREGGRLFARELLARLGL